MPTRTDPGDWLAGRRVIAPRPQTPPGASVVCRSGDEEGRCYACTAIALTVVVTLPGADAVTCYVDPESTSVLFEHAQAQHLQFTDAALLRFALVVNEAVRAMRQSREELTC
jgi:hypothetical protein